VVCTELDITKEASNNKKLFQVTYDQAKKLMMKDDLL
jgi:hypothetical protein